MEIIDTQHYKSKLHELLHSVCFDRAGQKVFNLEELFYPLQIDEGKYAFQSYAQQMTRVSQAPEEKKTGAEQIEEEKKRILRENRELFARLRETTKNGARKIHGEETQSEESLQGNAERKSGSAEALPQQVLEKESDSEKSAADLRDRQKNLPDSNKQSRELRRKNAFLRQNITQVYKRCCMQEETEEGSLEGTASTQATERTRMQVLSDHLTERDSQSNGTEPPLEKDSVESLYSKKEELIHKIYQQSCWKKKASDESAAETARVQPAEEVQTLATKSREEESELSPKGGTEALQAKEPGSVQSIRDELIRKIYAKSCWQKRTSAESSEDEAGECLAEKVRPAETDERPAEKFSSPKSKTDILPGIASRLLKPARDEKGRAGEKIAGQKPTELREGNNPGKEKQEAAEGEADENLAPEKNKQLDVSVESGSENDERLAEDETARARLLMEEEEGVPNGSLMLQQKSRVLVVASAGHGKTTLLKRIAIYYCSDGCSPEEQAFHEKENDELAETYSLFRAPQDRIPCLIYLRDWVDGKLSIEDMIQHNISDVFCMDEEKTEGTQEEVRNQIRTWVKENRSRLMLCLDGLDELPDNRRLEFLQNLETYLREYPQTDVILTSRVAGLSERGVKQRLAQMSFHGRSIMPLTEEHARQYSELWIGVTQAIEDREKLTQALNKILTDRRYGFLKKFMRTPLELLVILKQMGNQTLSLNRYQMFHDMLWEFFTNHERKYSRKRAVFEDIMTLLGYIAYYMQVKNSLYVSADELEEISTQLQYLSFQTDILREKSVDSVVRELDILAANVGIIERDDRGDKKGYTFPIRTYQEYLTAYACCHLSLERQQIYACPVDILGKHLDDSRWMNIVNFALSDLSYNAQSDFEELLITLFAKVQDSEWLISIVEADLVITRDLAEVLCGRIFRKNYLDGKQWKLLISCMGTQSAHAYNYALRSMYLADETTEQEFLSAASLTNVMWGFSSEQSPCDMAMRHLRSEQQKTGTLGARMVSVIARACLGEKFLEPYMQKAKANLTITEEMTTLLYEGAVKYGDPIFATALADLWVSGQENVSLAEKCLDSKMADLVMRSIDEEIRHIFNPRNKAYTPERLREMLRTLGTMPIHWDLVGEWKSNPVMDGLLDKLLLDLRQNKKLDRVAYAIVNLYRNGDEESFFEYWEERLKDGRDAVSLVPTAKNKRERSHFLLMREWLGKDSHTVNSSFYRERMSYDSGKPAEGVDEQQRLIDSVRRKIRKIQPKD